MANAVTATPFEMVDKLSPADRRRTVLTPYVKERLRKEISENDYGHAAKIARALGCAPATISNIKNGKADVGEDIEAGLAEYWKMSVAELDAASAKWLAEEAGDAIDGAPSSRAALPGRIDAISVARRWGYADRAIDTAQREAPASATNRSARWWFELIQQQQRLLEMMGEPVEMRPGPTKTTRIANRLSTQSGLTPGAKKLTKAQRK